MKTRSGRFSFFTRRGVSSQGGISTVCDIYEESKPPDGRAKPFRLDVNTAESDQFFRTMPLQFGSVPGLYGRLMPRKEGMRVLRYVALAGIVWKLHV